MRRHRHTWRCLNSGDAKCPENLERQDGLGRLDSFHVPCEDPAGTWLTVLVCENGKMAEACLPSDESSWIVETTLVAREKL